jgi:ketol-acid reductoisomerase
MADRWERRGGAGDAGGRREHGLEKLTQTLFAKDWVREYQTGYKRYNALLKAGEKHQIEKTGAYLRSMMPWMAKKNLKGVQASY